MNLKLKRTPGIYVVGFMASGKSTVGRHLAHRLGWNFFDTDSRNRGGREDHHRGTFREARRAGVPPHRDRDHPPARALDRARPSRCARAWRRGVRLPGEPASCWRTTASRSGWTARSRRCRSAWLQRAWRRCGRWPAMPGSSRRLYQSRRDVLRPGRCPRDDRDGRPRANGRCDPGASAVPMNTKHTRTRSAKTRCDFSRGAGGGRPGRCRDAPPERARSLRGSATSTWSAQGRPEHPWRRRRSACWAGGSPPG